MIGLLGVLAGAGYGFVAQRGAFCLNSGFRNAFASGELTKVKAFALAVAVQMVLLPVAFASGVVSLSAPPFFLVGALVGGVLFGASMRWAAGCAAGVFFKAGGGSTGALAAIAGMILGAALLEIPLQGTRDLLRGPELVLPALLGLEIHGAGSALLVALGAGTIILLWRSRVSSAGAWTWRRTGLLLGAVGTAAWVLSGIAGRDFGLAIIPGAVGLIGFVIEDPSPLFDLSLVIGVPLGAALALRAVPRFAPSPARVLAKRFAGGLGLGAGASLAAGCTVGHGLAGLPLLAPGSVVTILAIFVGANLLPIARRFLRPSAALP